MRTPLVDVRPRTGWLLVAPLVTLTAALALAALGAPGCSCRRRTPDTPSGDGTSEATSSPTAPPPARELAPARARLHLERRPSLAFEGAPEPAEVVSLALSPDGGVLVATGWGRRVVFFDLAHGVGREVARIDDDDAFEPGAAAWSGGVVAIGTRDHAYLLHADGTSAAKVEGRSAPLVAFGPGFARNRSDTLELLDRDGRIVRGAEMPSLVSLVVADGTLYAFTRTGVDEILALDPDSLQVRASGPAHAASIWGRGPFLAVYGNQVHVLDGVHFGEPLATGGLAWDFRAMDARGGIAVGAGRRHGVTLFDVRARAPLASVDFPTTSDILLDPVANRVFVAGPEGVSVLAIVDDAAE